MTFIKQLSKSKIAQVVGSALVLALLISVTGIGLANTGSAIPLPTTVTANCSGGNTPQVNVSWLPVANQTANSLQKRILGGDWAFLFMDPLPFSNYSYVDKAVISGNTYEYRVKTDVQVASNIVTVAVNASTCGGTTTPPGGTCLPTPPNGQPRLNIWPITNNGADCTDYALLAVKNVSNNTAYMSGIPLNAHVGDTLRVRLYVHNGVMDTPENIARNVMLKANIPSTTGSATISALVWADNADQINSAQKGGNVTVNMGSNEFLSYVQGSALLFDRGPSNQRAFSDSVVTSGASVGDMHGCFPFLHFVTFELKVNATTPPIITLPAPTNLTAVCIGGNTPQINLVWNSVANQTANSLERRVDNGGWAFILMNPQPFSVFNYSDTNVSFGHTYYYQVKTDVLVASNTVSVTPSGPNCGAIIPPQTGTIKLIKQVINNNGGTKQVSDFSLFINGQSVTSGVPKTLSAGTYIASETNQSGYQLTGFSGSCSSSGVITLQAGQNLVCTLTNNDVPPGSFTATATATASASASATATCPNGQGSATATATASATATATATAATMQLAQTQAQTQAQQLAQQQATALANANAQAQASAQVNCSGGGGGGGNNSVYFPNYFVNVLGTNVNLNLSKRAFNQTQNVDATTTTARSGDIILYTMSVNNTGNAPANNFVFQDDLSDVLQLSHLQSFGDGQFYAGNLTLQWSPVTVPANGRVDKTFTVVVNNSFPTGSDNTMTNTFGNTLNIRVNTPQVLGAFYSPKTGNTLTMSFVLAFVIMLLAFAWKQKEFLIQKLSKYV